MLLAVEFVLLNEPLSASEAFVMLLAVELVLNERIFEVRGAGACYKVETDQSGIRVIIDLRQNNIHLRHIIIMLFSFNLHQFISREKTGYKSCM